MYAYLCWCVCVCFAERALCKSATIRRCVTRAARTHQIHQHTQQLCARSTPECSVIMESDPIRPRWYLDSSGENSRCFFCYLRKSRRNIRRVTCHPNCEPGNKDFMWYDEIRLCALGSMGAYRNKICCEGRKSTPITDIHTFLLFEEYVDKGRLKEISLISMSLAIFVFFFGSDNCQTESWLSVAISEVLTI